MFSSNGMLYTGSGCGGRNECTVDLQLLSGLEEEEARARCVDGLAAVHDGQSGYQQRPAQESG